MNKYGSSILPMNPDNLISRVQCRDVGNCQASACSQCQNLKKLFLFHFCICDFAQIFLSRTRCHGHIGNMKNETETKYFFSAMLVSNLTTSKVLDCIANPSNNFC